MAEKYEDVDFVLQQPVGFYKEAFLFVKAGETVAQGDTITIDEYEKYVNEIVSVSAHVAETGLPVQYSYDGNELTKVTASTSRDVVKISFK